MREKCPTSVTTFFAVHWTVFSHIVWWNWPNVPLESHPIKDMQFLGMAELYIESLKYRVATGPKNQWKRGTKGFQTPVIMRLIYGLPFLLNFASDAITKPDLNYILIFGDKTWDMPASLLDTLRSISRNGPHNIFVFSYYYYD